MLQCSQDIVKGAIIMQRREVPFTYQYEQTMDMLGRGGLLLAASKKSGQTNAMTIGWGTVGIIWRKKIFVVLVRPSRYTYQFIEESGTFTVNVPTPEMREFVAFCGSKSGRDVDKFAAFKMTTSPAQRVEGVTLDACPLVYECKVVHHNDVIPAHLATEIISTAYANGDFHRLYYGEIMGAFAKE
jgi:flavin reductase (DIM6/NTAB) family NADH-FMN oxidoreductase RutF